MATAAAQPDGAAFLPIRFLFLVVAAVVRGGGGCQGSAPGRPRSGVALTATTATFTTIASEERLKCCNVFVQAICMCLWTRIWLRLEAREELSGCDRRWFDLGGQ
jgi:hypothetical protein